VCQTFLRLVPVFVGDPAVCRAIKITQSPRTVVLELPMSTDQALSAALPETRVSGAIL